MHTLVNKQRHLLDIPAAALQRCKYSNKKDKKDKKNKKNKKKNNQSFFIQLSEMELKTFCTAAAPTFAGQPRSGPDEKTQKKTESKFALR